MKFSTTKILSGLLIVIVVYSGYNSITLSFKKNNNNKTTPPKILLPKLLRNLKFI